MKEELELVQQITTPAQQGAVTAYIEKTKQRSERDRQSDVKSISGVFTGAYALHPFTQERVPIWVGDYVLAGYGSQKVFIHWPASGKGIADGLRAERK